MLSSLYAKLIGAGVVLLIIGGLYTVLRITQADLKASRADNAVLQSTLDQQAEVNRRNLVSMRELQAQASIDMALVTADRDRALDNLKAANNTRERIIHAAALPAGDGPIAPALAAALDGLRERAAAHPAGPNRNGAGQDPGAATALPGRAPDSGSHPPVGSGAAP